MSIVKFADNWKWKDDKSKNAFKFQESQSMTDLAIGE